MKEIFTLYADSKGRATVAQLHQVLTTLDINCTKQECETFFREVDTNADGFIDFTEFIRGLKWIKTVRKLWTISDRAWPWFMFSH